ncbi:MAG TPA: matrixin family metalloprotease [Sphingomicrobium sp.]
MGDLYSLLKNKLNKIEVNGKTLYIAEGDTLLDDDQLKIYADVREKENAAREAAKEADKKGVGAMRLEVGRGLVAMTKDGKVIRWKPGTVLSYRVVRSTFDPAEYQLVVANLKAATEAWEKTCGVNFQHVADKDGEDGTGQNGCLFVAYKFDAGGSVIASSFFPSDPPDRRHLLIDPSYFTTGFDKVGVFRHELGHILGFRHEHIRNEAPPVCPNEPLWDVQVLGQYDPHSVMHYFCGGVGSHDLQITELDRKGARMVYGPPLGAAALVDA